MRHFEIVMNEELKLVFKYCIKNKLSFNLTKANYMVISPSRLNGSIHIDNIERESQIKYLGADIDQNLHWGPSIQQKCSYHKKAVVFSSNISSYLTYSITSWGSACKTRLHKIKTKQNKCVRSMFFACSSDHAMPYFSLLEILTLESIYKFKVALFTLKITNKYSKNPRIRTCQAKIIHLNHFYIRTL